MQQYLAGGGFVGLLAFAGFLLIRLLHVLNLQISKVDVEVSDWKKERRELQISHARCEERLSILIKALRAEGIPVPREVWDI